MYKYCEQCGHKTKTVPIDSYNRKTGKRLTVKVCSNLKCEIGCHHEGHKYGSFWRFQDPNECQRCKYTARSYY